MFIFSVKPTITQGPSAIQVLEGKASAMNCKVLGTPYPVSRITWLNNNAPIEVSTTANLITNLLLCINFWI
jgi:hypothetical protein